MDILPYGELRTQSEGSTVLLSPGPSADELTNDNHDDVFAWLRPVSDLAREAFSASINSVLKDPQKYQHNRRFLHIDDRRVQARSPYSEDESGPEDEPLQWSGAFKFSLKILPLQPTLGWYLGTSRGRQPQEVDLLLAPPIARWESQRIAGRHLRLFFHDQSCRMMLDPRHSVIIPKDGVSVINQSKMRVIENGDFFQIHHCLYVFEYTDLISTSRFQQDLVQFMRDQRGLRWSLNELLSPAKTAQPVSLAGHWCSPSAFAQGTFGKVCAGWAQDGRPVAIKVLKEPRQRELDQHQRIMRKIGHHPNILQLLLVDSQFDRVPSACCIYSPLAIGSLSRLFRSHSFDLYLKSRLLVDYLQGLAFLHEKGIMHRDINPNNLSVTSLSNPSGLIIDLDAATDEIVSTDHGVGTLAYLAPEIVLLKKQVPSSYYKSVDVWALGLSAYALYLGTSLTWHLRDAFGNIRKSDCVTEKTYVAFQDRIAQQVVRDLKAAPYLDLVKKMTKYESTDRLSASLARDAAIKLADELKGEAGPSWTLKRPRAE